MSFLHKLNTNIYEKQAHKIYPETAIKEKNPSPNLFPDKEEERH